MDLRVLHYFLTVAREQSFTKASKQLHITQPTLSRQLAALEEEFIRSWRAQNHIDRRRIIAKTSCSGDHRP